MNKARSIGLILYDAGVMRLVEETIAEIKETANADLKRLLELQQLDLETAELESQLDAIPREIVALEEQLKDSLDHYEQGKQELADNQKLRREWEGEIQLLQEKISKHKGQLYELKSNQQYRVMVHEIDQEESRVHQWEDRILEKMMEAEQSEKRIRESEQVLNGRKVQVDRKKKELEASFQVAQKNLKSLRGRRAALAETISSSVLETYQAVRKFRRGKAVAEARDGFCTACNVRLRPQAYNEVQSKQGIITCESCNRILYYAEPPPQPFAGAAAG